MKLTCIYRPRPAASPTVALGVRSVGRYTISNPLNREIAGGPTLKHCALLYWGIRGRGYHIIENVREIMQPGDIAVYMPGMLQHYAPLEDEWEYYFVTLDGPLAPTIMEGLGIYPGVHRVGPPPTELFERLQRMIGDPSAETERLCSAMGYELLARAHGKMTRAEQAPILKAVLHHMHKHWNEPALTVAGLANGFRIHRSTLCRKFHDELGRSPADYIQVLRLRNARSLLLETTLNVAEIARQCGYTDSNYFTRLFKTKTGLSPLAFRKRTSASATPPIARQRHSPPAPLARTACMNDRPPTLAPPDAFRVGSRIRAGHTN